MTETTTLPQESKPRGIAQQFLEPFNLLRSEVDRMFDEFPARWPALHPARVMGGMLPPAVEMTETPQSYKISIEVPGIDPEEIVLQVEGDRLVLKGEKREERDEEEEDYTLSERSYGSFERRMALPQDAVLDDIAAKAKNGVLKITIPRNQQAAPARRRIAIQSTKKG